MITLYLVRHGETEYNLQARIQGQGDSPLTALGVRQAEAVAGRLAREKFAAAYSSDLGRAQATAEIIVSRHSLSVQTTPLLREAAFGVIQGLTRAEIEAKFPAEEHAWRRDPKNKRPPGAEYPQDVIERGRKFLAEVIERHNDGENVLIVGHGGSVRGLVIAASDAPVHFYRVIHFSNCGLSIIDVGEATGIHVLNDTCHLTGVAVTDVDMDNA